MAKWRIVVRTLSLPLIKETKNVKIIYQQWMSNYPLATWRQYFFRIDYISFALFESSVLLKLKRVKKQRKNSNNGN